MNRDLKNIRKRIDKLCAVIDNHRYLYHVLDNPKISDEAYDSLFEELKILEEKYPSFVAKTSPTGRVGDVVRPEFTKVVHVAPQWSFDDIFDNEGLSKWISKINRMAQKNGFSVSDVDYCTELKIDGIKIILIYKDGLFVQASTRGDGKEGEDITCNVKTIQSIPLILKEVVDIIVVGEAWLATPELKRINKDRESKGEQQFANTRNATAGSLRQLNSRITASRRLNSFVYDIDMFDPKKSKLLKPATQCDELELLKVLGFKVNQEYKLLSSEQKIEEYYKNWDIKRHEQEYGIDGMVLKINNIQIQESLGHTSKSPRFGVAYKFPAEQVTTVVDNITFQVGRTGVVTPVANLRPVRVAGSIVSRATLHNEDEIARLDVRIGDTVILQKAGDVIPDIVSVVLELRNGNEKKFVFPDSVLDCDGPVERVSGSSAHRCVNKNSYAQKRRRFHHFVSKKAFNVDGCGPKIIDILIEKQLISTFDDIYTLKKGDLLTLPRFAEMSVDNLLASIDKSRKIELPKFIVGLSIDHVGEETALLLAQTFGTLKKIQNSTLEKLETIDGIGGKVAQSVYIWFNDVKNKRLIDRLLNQVKIISFIKVQEKDKYLNSLSFVLTGSLPNMSRDSAKQMIQSKGGKVVGSVSKNTDYVVAGKEPGSKFRKAQKLGIKILSEKAFLELMK